MDATSMREAALFNAARRLPAAERAPYLDRACAGDALLRRQIEELLKADESAGAFLSELAAGAGETPGPGATLRVSQPPAEQPGDQLGRYQLIEPMGEGGCGVVYVAEQTEPVRRQVALKVIKLGMDTRQVVARFEAERQALAMMDHPNIAKVFDAGATEAGRPYFVMELVRGVRITDYCDQAKLSPPERLALFIQICQAIQHAHQKGIIHRDIKPSNILVALHDGVPVPKVIDFGIAKATEGRLSEATVYTQLHQFMGTPAYMSPEQAEMSGLDIDTRSDIYSLGVLLYELLVGSTPFDAKELMAAGLDKMRQTIREREPVRPSTKLAALAGEQLTTTAKRRSVEASRLVHLLRGDLDWIVMKCLEKDRNRRYETANGLAADVKRHLNREPVVARPPGNLYRLQKMVQRNQLAFAAAGAVVAALVLGLGVSTSLFLRESKAHDRAVAAEREQNRARTTAQTAQANEIRQRQAAQRSLYAASLSLAQQAWDLNHIGRLRQLLEETATWPERGFEWHYWQRQAHLELKTLHGHHGGILPAAFSPDGQRIVTGSEDKTAKVWEAATGRELLTLRGHLSGIWSAAFSLDGQRIVTGSGDQTAKVWEAATGRELLTLPGHSGGISSVVFSPDGQQIVTCAGDLTARVWEAATGRELLTLKGRGNYARYVGSAPNGQRIVTGIADLSAQVWDAVGGAELLSLKGHAALIRSLAISPDGRQAATGSDDQTVKVWNIASGREILTLQGHRGSVVRVAFSADGQRVVTASTDQTAKVWDAASGKELFTLKGHSGSVVYGAFSPDGQRVVTASADQTAKVWRLAGGQDFLTLQGHGASLRAVAFSPDGQRVATASADQTAKVWDAATGRELAMFNGHSAGLRSVAFSPDGQRIVTASADQTAKVWDAATGQDLLTLQGHNAAVSSAAISPDGRWIATGSADQTARICEAASGRELRTLKGHHAGISSVAFSPDGQRIVTGSGDQTARVWEAATGRELLALQGHSDGISSVAFSPDGRRIATGSGDQTARVWEAATGQELLVLKGHSDAISSVAFSPDGQRIVTASADQLAKLWDAVSGKELLTLKGHGKGVNSVAFSPDGQRIATGSQDQAARVWEAATARQVAAWQSEEQTAAGRLATLRQELAAAAGREGALRARDPGAIKQWLVLAPIPFEGRNGPAALAQEQIPGEARIRPRAGDRVKVGASALVWTVSQREDYLLDFNQFLGEATFYSVAYALCYIQSDADQPGLLMKVASDDQAKVYLNGREIYRRQEGRSYVPDQDVVADVHLQAGLNVLLFKVVNETLDWQGSVRFTDSAGQPVKGLGVTLAPP
jgi:WD40 repeat protein/serine/threonine protein kinase